jgi:hypothetical protein
MQTKELATLAIAAALCGGCGTLASQRTETVNSATQTKKLIFVGQPIEEAKTLLLQAGVEDLSHVAISLIPYRHGEYRWYWYRLPNGRWLFVLAVKVGESNQFVIDELVLGDKDIANIKKRGLKGYPEIQRLELP